MNRSSLPGDVESFVEATKRFLAGFDVELSEIAGDMSAAAQGRAYRLLGQEWETTLFIRHTREAVGDEAGQYRARAVTELPSEVAAMLAGKEAEANIFATLGALTIREGAARVVCHSLVRETTWKTTAGIMAAAMVHSAPSLLRPSAGIRDQGPIADLSEWTDLDFEQLHYDYAHLGVGSIEGRGISQSILPLGSLALEALDDHPYWGGGLLARLRPDPSLFRIEGKAISANELNLVADRSDDAPMFGAWCKRDGDFWFVCFAPNLLKQLDDFTGLLIGAAKKRLLATPALVDQVLQARS
jgi:hypothetical protein